MTLEIQGVPEKLTRGEVFWWLAQLGIDAKVVPLGSKVTLNRDSICIEVYAYDAHGKLLVGANDEVARNYITIPIVD